VLLASGIVGFVVVVFSSFVDDGYSTWGWASAPLFVYGALVGFGLPATVILLRRAGLGLRPTPFGTSWAQVHLAAAGFAFLNALSILLTRVGATGGAVVAVLASLGLVAGAIDARRGEPHERVTGSLAGWVVRSRHDRRQP
jgi:hypothetical protein